MKEREDHSFEDTFRVLARQYFDRFCRVTTEFDFIVEPMKSDLVVARCERENRGELNIFSHFEQVNLLRFHPAIDSDFTVEKHLSRVYIYLGEVMLAEKLAGFEGLTFTIVCSTAPGILLERYKESCERVRAGIYRITGLMGTALHIVVCDEVEGELDEEMALLKLFSTGRELDKFLLELLYRVHRREEGFDNYLHYAFALYREELIAIVEREAETFKEQTGKELAVTLIEKNLTGWMEDLGLKERFISEGFNKGVAEGRRDGLKEGLEKGVLEGKVEDALEMLKDSLPLESISKYTRLPLERIEELKKSVSGLS